MDGFECVLVRAESANCDHMLPSLHSSHANGPHHNLYHPTILVQIAEKLDQSSHLGHGGLCHLQQGPTDTVEQAGTFGWKGNDEAIGGMHLNMAYIASVRKLYGDGGLQSMLVDSDVYAPATARLMLEGKQVSRGNRGMKLMLEALYRLYQEAFWAWMQQRDQTHLRRNDMDKLVRDIQQAFASGDRESARLVS